MTTQEVHEHNKRNAISAISYPAVARDEAVIGFRSWIEKWLDIAYEAGFKAAKEGKL